MSYDTNGNRRTRLSRQNTFGENQHFPRDINVGNLRPTLSTRVVRRTEQPRQAYLPEIRLEQHTQRSNEHSQGNHNLIRRAATDGNTHQFLTVKDFESSLKAHSKNAVKSQRSCESYDSAASGMSWSSSPSSSAIQMRGSDYRSNSMSSNHSVSGFEEASYTDRSETPFNKSKNIEFTPMSAQRSMDESYTGRSISSKSRKAVRPVFAAGLSYEDETDVSMAVTPEYTSLQSSVEVNHLHQANVTAVPEQDAKTEESTANCLESFESKPRRNSRTIWKKAFNFIRVANTLKGKNWKRLVKKRSEEEEEQKSSSPEEIDPIYQLLKSAASKHRQICGDISTTVVNLKPGCETNDAHSPEIKSNIQTERKPF